MTKKFDRVLSEDDLVDIFALGIGNLTAKPFDELVEVLEQAILAKLVEQEPVATVAQETFSSNGTSDIITNNLPIGVKLYTHPIPNCQGLLDNSNHVVGNNEMVTPLAQRKIQTLLDKGEYRVIENATVLVNRRGHAAIVNRGGAFYWVDNEALAREFDAAGVEVLGCTEVNQCNDNSLSVELDSKDAALALQEYLDKLEGWRLVQVEPEQALLISMAVCLNHGFGLLSQNAQKALLYDMRKVYDEVVGKGYYSTEVEDRYLSMIAAAPKFWEGGDEN